MKFKQLRIKLNEESFKLVDMSKKTAAIADKLAKKIGLDTDFKGGVTGVELTVKGSKKKVEKWLQSLPLEGVNEEKIAILTSVYKSVKRDMDKLMKKHDAYVSDTSRDGTTISSPKPMGAFIKDVQKLIGLKESVEFLSEGMYTADDGGAFDGLRIAKYLAHQDGKKWKGLAYGTLSSYIDAGTEMLKRNKSKARDILSQPTPRD